MQSDGTFTVNWTIGNSETGSNRYMLVRAYSVTPNVGTTNGVTADGTLRTASSGPALRGSGHGRSAGRLGHGHDHRYPRQHRERHAHGHGPVELLGNNKSRSPRPDPSRSSSAGTAPRPPGRFRSARWSPGTPHPRAPPTRSTTTMAPAPVVRSPSKVDETQTVTDLPYGSYTLSEVNAPAGATISPNPAVVGPNSPQVDITVTNPYPNVGSFSVKKQVTGETGGYVAGSQFVVGYSCTNGPSGSLTLDQRRDEVGRQSSRSAPPAPWVRARSRPRPVRATSTTPSRGTRRT